MQARRDFPLSPLLSLFLRDGLLYYFSVFVVFLVNLMLFRFGDSTAKNLFAGFLDVIPCMFGTRVLINILSLMHDEFGDNATIVPPLSEPQFAQRGTFALGGFREKTAEAGTATSSTASSGSAETDDHGLRMRANGSGSSGATLSVSVGIEEVLRVGGVLDVEKAP
ncbi:hypothetical protein C8Q74DRAFT_649499 [Fomes fomentarius]|nr:hypothetical protein C8Q74DRAFT_649499 [Fomes fomentarius]